MARVYLPAEVITASAIIYTGRCLFGGFFLGMDQVNDPTITIYDGLDNTGKEIIPTNNYFAAQMGLNGPELSTPIPCGDGIYIEIACDGTCEVVALYRPDQFSTS